MKATLPILLLLLPFLAYNQNYQGKQKEIDAILAEIKAFSEHVVAGDSEKIAAAYTADAKIFPSGREILAGSQDILTYWTFPSDNKITYHKILPEEIVVRKKEAYDYGYYEGKTQRADGSTLNWRGKYVIIWKKVAGQWKIYLDIWNRVEE
ncbi:MAG: DUF4440 domain-containing protein [Bacteroidota bacterium]